MDIEVSNSLSFVYLEKSLLYFSFERYFYVYRTLDDSSFSYHTL